MIVDTSALVAVLRDEVDAERYATALGRAARTRMSAATLVELGIVVRGTGDPVLEAKLEELLQRVAVEIEPFTAEHVAVARQAHRDYGRGTGHPARLNLGDCFSYALARTTGEPLLFKGDDFVHTDLRSALDG